VLGFTVDANGVGMVRHRAAQYRASIDPETKAMLHTQHLNTDGSSEKKSRTKLSEEGFNDVPSFTENLGGCIADEIVRRGVLNFIPLRKYDETLQKYLLGLGLLMLTYPLDHDYRSGTLLVQDPERLPKVEIVHRSGRREPIQITHEEALAFAEASAVAFGVGQNQSFILNNETYKQYQKSGAAEIRANNKKRDERNRSRSIICVLPDSGEQHVIGKHNATQCSSDLVFQSIERNERRWASRIPAVTCSAIAGGIGRRI
jgi:hypothetical protein